MMTLLAYSAAQRARKLEQTLAKFIAPEPDAELQSYFLRRFALFILAWPVTVLQALLATRSRFTRTICVTLLIADAYLIFSNSGIWPIHLLLGFILLMVDLLTNTPPTSESDSVE
jgi:hypothetical protein